MSGRLVILPKKSYCPWNPENVERVLRDEAEHARQQEQQRQQEQKEASILRRKQLAPTSSNDNRKDASSEARFSLFAAEEKEYNDKMVAKAMSPPVVNRGVHPEYLGGSVRNAPTPFYLDKPPSTGPLSNPKEERRKNQLDPMKDICPSRPSAVQAMHPVMDRETTVEQAATRDKNTKSPKTFTSRRKRDTSSDTDSSHSDHSAERSRRRKHRRSKHSSRHSSSHREEKRSKRRKHKEAAIVVGPSMEDLRKERLEREALERQRQENLIQRECGHQMTRYQDQFNPRFSRN